MPAFSRRDALKGFGAAALASALPLPAFGAKGARMQSWPLKAPSRTGSGTGHITVIRTA